jgi:hypothetical protein
METSERSGQRDLQVLAILGAIVAAAGTILPWAKVKGWFLTSGTIAGYKFWEAKAVLILAAFMALRALLHRPGARNMALPIAIGGLAIAALAAFFVAQYRNQLTNDLARALFDMNGGTLDSAKDEARLVEFFPQIGAFVSILGGLLGCLGGVAATVRGRRVAKPVPAAATSYEEGLPSTDLWGSGQASASEGPRDAADRGGAGARP